MFSAHFSFLSFFFETLFFLWLSISWHTNYLKLQVPKSHINKAISKGFIEDYKWPF